MYLITVVNLSSFLINNNNKCIHAYQNFPVLRPKHSVPVIAQTKNTFVRHICFKISTTEAWSKVLRYTKSLWIVKGPMWSVLQKCESSLLMLATACKKTRILVQTIRQSNREICSLMWFGGVITVYSSHMPPFISLHSSHGQPGYSVLRSCELEDGGLLCLGVVYSRLTQIHSYTVSPCVSVRYTLKSCCMCSDA